MNAKEKREILETNGYRYEKANNYMSYWYDAQNEKVVVNKSFAQATSIAYGHLLESPTPAIEAETAQAESATLVAPFPRYVVGQHVIAGNHGGVITAIRQQQNDNYYTFENSFPSNAWFQECELEAYAPVAIPDVLKQSRETIERLEAALKEAQARIDRQGEIIEDCQTHAYRLEGVIMTAIAKNDTVSPLDAMMTLFTLKREFESVMAQNAPPPAPVTDVPFIETQILPSKSIGDCEMCGGDGWLLEPVEGYRAKRTRCKYCDGTGNEYDFDEIYRQQIERDNEDLP